MRIILLLLLFIYFHSIIICQNISPLEKKADLLADKQYYKTAIEIYNNVLADKKNNINDSIRIIIKKAEVYYQTDDNKSLKEIIVLLDNYKNNLDWCSHIELIKGKYFDLIQNYDSAAIITDRAIQKRIKYKKDVILADMYNFRAVLYYKKNEFNRSKIYLRLAIKYYLLENKFNDNIIKALLIEANIYWINKDFVSFKYIIDIANKNINLFKITDKLTSLALMNLGSYYLNQSDYFNAYKSFSKLNKYKLDSITTYQSYYYQTMSYYYLGDYALSSNYYHKIKANINSLDYNMQSDLNFYYSYNQLLLENYDSTLFYLNKCQITNKISKRIKKEYLYHLFATSYFKKNELDSALKYNILAINEFKDNNSNDPEFAKSILLKGKILNNESSEILYDLAQKIILNNCRFKETRTANIFLETGIVRYQNKLYPKALQDFQQALNSVDLDFNSKNVFENPECKNVLSAVNLAKALRYKSETLEQIYLQNDSLQYLEVAYETSKLLTTQVEKMLMSYPLFESKQFLLDNSADIFSRAQYLGYLCFKKTGKTRYKNENLELAEKSRAAILNAQIQENEFAAQSLNDSLSQQLLEIEQNISYITSQINELSNLDNKLTNKLKNDLFELYEKKNKLIEGYKGEYGNFSNYFKKSKALTFNQLLNFPSDNEVVLEYTLCDSIILLNVVQRAKHEIFEIVFDSILKQKLEVFQKQIVFDYSKNYTGINTEEINKLGNYLYNKLILPAEAYTSGKQLIIVQEPKLKFIPFDAFFVNNKYLIEQHAISYIFTINITTENNRNILSCNKQRIAAFFPSYDLDEKKLTLFSEKYYKTLGNLNNKVEAEQLSNIVECDTFMVQNATEENFKKLAGNYTILHLSLHSILNPENFLLSKLCFTPTNDSLNDGLFNICDVAPLKLNAQLTVLSGCNTGDGQQIASEGAMSFARSFILAGSRSILMSLWKLNYSSAVAINIGFYKYLTNGYNKSEALQLSKIDYLKNTDKFHKHPFFWSGFVLIGDNKCIVLPTHYTIIEKITFIIVTIIVIFMVLFFLKKR